MLIVLRRPRSAAADLASGVVRCVVACSRSLLETIDPRLGSSQWSVCGRKLPLPIWSPAMIPQHSLSVNKAVAVNISFAVNLLLHNLDTRSLLLLLCHSRLQLPAEVFFLLLSLPPLARHFSLSSSSFCLAFILSYCRHLSVSHPFLLPLSTIPYFSLSCIAILHPPPSCWQQRRPVLVPDIHSFDCDTPRFRVTQPDLLS